MATTGGEALAMGVWYQTVGGIASLGTPWYFTGTAPEIRGQCAGIIDRSELQLIMEYFDMDAALCEPHGFTLIQFKVSTQHSLRGFGTDEARDILRSASLAILQHEQLHSRVPIVRFILATNREKGACFRALETAIAGNNTKSADCILNQLGAILAPATLFPRPKRRVGKETSVSASSEQGTDEEIDDEAPQVPVSDKTMRQLADSITSGLGEFTRQEWTDACLKAMAHFSFASAHPQKLVDAIYQWLHTWGYLPGEEATAINQMIGILVSPHGSHAWNEMSIIREVLGSPRAEPLTPKGIAAPVIRDLEQRYYADAPTHRLIQANGFPDWMLDRSQLLQGLPTLYEEVAIPDPHAGGYRSVRLQSSPRIFAIVGPGGAGKTSLMAQLFSDLASSIWDWGRNELKDPPELLGFPLILDAEEGALGKLDRKVANWAGRIGTFNQPVERLAHACGLTDGEPALWLGLDGLDEIADEHLPRLAREIANIADSHRHIRIVITCRREQFKLVKDTLAGMGWMRELPVDDLEPGTEYEAIYRATNRELLIEAPTEPAVIGETRSESPSYVIDDDFLASLRQPLFVGVIRAIYERDGVSVIQRAYDGDDDARREVAQDYVYIFCERTARRIRKSFVSPRGIFRALKQLAESTPVPSGASRADWMKVCECQLDEHITPSMLRAHFAASGLIRDLGSGAFEWRHPFVIRYLAVMRESPAW